MSNGRRHRRRIKTAAIIQPAGAIELDAETRAVLAEVLAAHDDPAVTLEAYLPVIGRLYARLPGLNKEQRLEVAGQVAARSIGARFVGWGRR